MKMEENEVPPVILKETSSVSLGSHCSIPEKDVVYQGRMNEGNWVGCFEITLEPKDSAL